MAILSSSGPHSWAIRSLPISFIHEPPHAVFRRRLGHGPRPQYVRLHRPLNSQCVDRQLLFGTP